MPNMPTTREPRELNVLLITVDQWRGDTLGAVGHPLVQTPNLDRLAAAGVLFRRHFAQAAPCGPSRASLHTGLYLMTHRSATNGTPLDRRFTNVALEARALGYAPALFGYTDTSSDPRGLAPDDPVLTSYEGVLAGFDAIVNLPEDAKPWGEWLATRHGYDVPTNVRDLLQPRQGFSGSAGRGPTFPPARYAAEHSEAAFLVESFTTWATYRAPRHPGPWFAHLAFIRPHPPFVAPEPYHDMYDPADVPPLTRAATLEHETAVHPFLAGAVRSPHVRDLEWDRWWRQVRATYYGMMSEVDAQLGRLWDWLVTTGRWNDTVIVLTSDHGEQLGDHWLWGKLGWFDQSYHVPLIVRDPRPKADATRGSQVERFTEHVDVLPTLVDLLGGTIPRQCDGCSLMPFLHADDPATAAPDDWRREVHWEFDFRFPGAPRVDEMNLCVLRDDRGKYIQFASAGMPALFYDLVDDPGETVNRAGDPACAPTVLGYAERMLAWRMRHADRTLSHCLVGPGGLSTL